MSDKDIVKDALRLYLKEAERYMRVRLSLFSERHYQHYGDDRTHKIDITMFNWSVDRVQSIRRLLREYE